MHSVSAIFCTDCSPFQHPEVHMVDVKQIEVTPLVSRSNWIGKKPTAFMTAAVSGNGGQGVIRAGDKDRTPPSHVVLYSLLLKRDQLKGY